MNEFLASTEQHELLAGRETAGLAQPVSDSTAATGHCDKKQRLIDEINQLTAQRDKYLSAAGGAIGRRWGHRGGPVDRNPQGAQQPKTPIRLQ